MLSQPQGHSAAGRIMSMKNSKDTIGNRTSDFLACNTVDVGSRNGSSNTVCRVSIVKVIFFGRVRAFLISRRTWHIMHMENHASFHVLVLTSTYLRPRGNMSNQHVWRSVTPPRLFHSGAATKVIWVIHSKNACLSIFSYVYSGSNYSKFIPAWTTLPA